MKDTLSLTNRYKEIVSYLLFGFLTTAVNWIVYTLCINGIGITMTLSNSFAWFVAVIFAYITNRRFVFVSKTHSIKGVVLEITLFFGARIVSGVFEIFMPTILYQLGIQQSFLGIEGFMAKAIVSILVIFLNYLFSKLFIFKKRGGKIT